MWWPHWYWWYQCHKRACAFFVIVCKLLWGRERYIGKVRPPQRLERIPHFVVFLKILRRLYSTHEGHLLFGLPWGLRKNRIRYRPSQLPAPLIIGVANFAGRVNSINLSSTWCNDGSTHTTLFCRETFKFKGIFCCEHLFDYMWPGDTLKKPCLIWINFFTLATLTHSQKGVWIRLLLFLLT